ncbi:hypothetical protein CSHISOI_03078 [Colletotrichum shisoi]|uniref:Aminoglycoside phosphotransferase domain-containing protein n=1 Tax=Colletotrichum shisoi TaxID=2078593 RepID=A0A5Q4BZF2_9PEZI|nr:hypothetical protein CSHISOI_03078 [Colletotrichum shisoi]
MNPFASRPEEIPDTDQYVDVPFYGRYFPTPDDFRIDTQYVNSQSARSLQYWASVLGLCDQSVRIYPADEGGRDVFALGSIIIKSSHLHEGVDGRHTEIDYSYADANEIQAIALARSVLRDMNVRVPQIYFAGKINGRQVLVQERIPGVGLNVARRYLSQDQRNNFKQQTRELIRRLHTIKPTDEHLARCHVVQDPDIFSNGRIGQLEADILFSDANIDTDMSFMHNDLNESNIIVDNDMIVGLVDWEMAGFFGWRTAGEVHRRIRTPQREHFAAANLSEEELQDIMWWADIYDLPEPHEDKPTH